MPHHRTDDAPVERSTLLDATTDEVLAALDDPDVLAAWLGAWTPDADGRGATVVTDDGVARRVAPAGATTASRRWVWSPVDDPSSQSVVTFTVRTEGERTRLTVTEATTDVTNRRTGAPVATSSVPWTAALLALGAVLAVGAPVTV